MTKLYDVIAVEMKTHKIELMAQNKTERNADAIETMAVYRRGEESESQLYEWLKWFDKNGFTVETGVVLPTRELHPIELMMGKHTYARMVKLENNIQP